MVGKSDVAYFMPPNKIQHVWKTTCKDILTKKIAFDKFYPWSQLQSLLYKGKKAFY